MNKRLENQINKIYKKVFNEVLNEKTLTQLTKGNNLAPFLKATMLSSSSKYDKFCEKFSKELAKIGLSQQKGIWRKYFQAAKELHYIALPPTYKQFEYKIMREAIDNNFKMIKSIPQKVLEVVNHKYTSQLIEEVAKGSVPRGSFKSLLEKHGNVNARLIARTEAAKLQTVIMENRATNLGSVAYIWRAANDSRTRPSHKEMNNVVVFWKHEKPHLDNMIGHAGEFPNCRCTPLPIFDEDDLPKSNLKVYNYNTFKIEKISLEKLLKSLKNNSLKI